MNSACHQLSIDFASRAEAEDFSFMLGQLGLPQERMQFSVSEVARPVPHVRRPAKKLAARHPASARRQPMLSACDVIDLIEGGGPPGGGPERRGATQANRES